MHSFATRANACADRPRASASPRSDTFTLRAVGLLRRQRYGPVRAADAPPATQPLSAAAGDPKTVEAPSFGSTSRALSQAIANMRKRVDRPHRIPPVPDAAGQRLGQTEPAISRAQQDQTAVGRDRTAAKVGSHPLALYGWKIERDKSIFRHGGMALSLLRWKDAEKRISTR